MKQKISDEGDRYDFKLIKKQFQAQSDSGVYLSSSELNDKLKDPTIQGGAEKLLNVWQNH